MTIVKCGKCAATATLRRTGKSEANANADLMAIAKFCILRPPPPGQERSIGELCPHLEEAIREAGLRREY